MTAEEALKAVEDRNLSFKPVFTSLEIIRARLKQGLTVPIRLEPGDHTRYDFILTPALSFPFDFRASYGLVDNEPWLILTPMNLSRECGPGIWAVPLVPDKMYAYHTLGDIYSEPYTKAVIATFIEILAGEEA